MTNRMTMSDGAVREQTAARRAGDREARPRSVPEHARSRTSRRYYVCVAILVLSAVGMQGTAKILGGYFSKAAVPLKRPLDALDQAKLLPEYEPHPVQPEPLDSETVANLGTKDYLQWNLVDRERDRNDPTSRVRLFLTYHTGRPDAVPHNPKECLAAGGMTLKDETSIEVRVPTGTGEDVVIPISVLEFEIPPRRNGLLDASESELPHLVVAYFFYANGRYETSRTGVRLAISNLWDRYAYYSKMELSFTDYSCRALADREQTIGATRRFVKKLMPILWEDHYQNWEALKSGAPPVIFDK